jgi:hypothetical protein
MAHYRMMKFANLFVEFSAEKSIYEIDNLGRGSLVKPQNLSQNILPH